MRKYVAERLLQAPLTLLLIGTVVFGALSFTGDPVLAYLGADATPAQVAELRAKLGLDQSITIQYVRFMKGVLEGDFGRSLRYGRPALTVVLDHVGPTLQLGVAALLLALMLGLIAGAVAAMWPGTWVDHAVGGASVVGLSMPSFWLGIVLIVLFAVDLRWLPTSGIGGTRYYILPSFTLAAFLAPQFTLMVRTSLLEITRENFVVTARGKGLSGKKVLTRHILPNAATPIVAFVSLQFGTLLGGAVVTETIFAWPGLGRLVIDAISQSDFPIVEGMVMLSGLGIILVNLVADLAIALIDPRIRYG